MFVNFFSHKGSGCRQTKAQSEFIKIKIIRLNFLGLILFFLYLTISCSRHSVETFENPPLPAAPPSAKPLAILQTGEYPLWFQLTDNGPVHIESIEDAIFSSALIPWPLALHVRFFHEKKNEIVMAVNRDGFLKLAPYSGAAEGLALYRFSGGGIWRQYTVGGFIYYEENPAVLLYLDDRFLDSVFPPPSKRTWAFNMESNTPFSLEIPALEFFPAEEGWSADTLRFGSDGLIYYRAVKRSGSQPEIRMLRTADPGQAGEEISLEVFYDSAPRRTEIIHPSLPPLPEDFYYTGIGRAGDSLFACWEEQADYSIGAAGFMVIKTQH